MARGMKKQRKKRTRRRRRRLDWLARHWWPRGGRDHDDLLDAFGLAMRGLGFAAEKAGVGFKRASHHWLSGGVGRDKRLATAKGGLAALIEATIGRRVDWHETAILEHIGGGRWPLPALRRHAPKPFAPTVCSVDLASDGDYACFVVARVEGGVITVLDSGTVPTPSPSARAALRASGGVIIDDPLGPLEESESRGERVAQAIDRWAKKSCIVIDDPREPGDETCDKEELRSWMEKWSERTERNDPTVVVRSFPVTEEQETAREMPMIGAFPGPRPGAGAAWEDLMPKGPPHHALFRHEDDRKEYTAPIDRAVEQRPEVPEKSLSTRLRPYLPAPSPPDDFAAALPPRAFTRVVSFLGIEPPEEGEAGKAVEHLTPQYGEGSLTAAARAAVERGLTFTPATHWLARAPCDGDDETCAERAPSCGINGCEKARQKGDDDDE